MKKIRRVASIRNCAAHEKGFSLSSDKEESLRKDIEEIKTALNSFVVKNSSNTINIQNYNTLTINKKDNDNMGSLEGWLLSFFINLLFILATLYHIIKLFKEGGNFFELVILFFGLCFFGMILYVSVVAIIYIIQKQKSSNSFSENNSNNNDKI